MIRIQRYRQGNFITYEDSKTGESYTAEVETVQAGYLDRLCSIINNLDEQINKEQQKKINNSWSEFRKESDGRE